MMNRCALLLLSLLLASCAVVPPAPVPRAEHLLADQRFAAASEPVNADDVFALSPAMKKYLATDIAAQVRSKGRAQALVDALYRKGDLKLEYDAALTRNAAQAFDARSGNCLSLVIMTAAFAKELGLAIEYRDVFTEETWGRSDDLFYSIGHVNLSLLRPKVDPGFARNEGERMTIDFLPPRDLRGLRTRVVGEDTIVAMYMNNRAVEAFARGQVDDAYWWARGAVWRDPQFLSAYNTLGVIYQRHGDLLLAEKTLRYVLDAEPENTRAMSNLVAVLNEQNRVAEAGTLKRKLEQLEPNPPFSYFNRGVAAMRDGNVKAAKELFEKEVDRAAYYHEFHFWLALAYVRLGEVEPARKHLTMAMENSTTRKDHDLYAAKLDRIRFATQQ